METIIIIAVIAVVALIVGGGIVSAIQNLPGALIRGVLNEAVELSNADIEKNPKSISAMTKVFLPQITREFPSFNWIDWKKEIEEFEVDYLEGKGNTEVFVHRTEISGFENLTGSHKILVQSAIQYAEPGQVLGQYKYEVELLYASEETERKKTQGVWAGNCPNCGAPLNSARLTSCEYCGAAVEQNGLMQWQLGKIRKLV